MAVEMSVSKIPPSKEELHAKEVDALKEQCDTCKLYKKDNKHGGCEVRWKLVSQDSDVAWKKKTLFLDRNGNCKMYQKRYK